MKRRKCATFCMYPCLATFFSSERRTGGLCRELTWAEFGMDYIMSEGKGAVEVDAANDLPQKLTLEEYYSQFFCRVECTVHCTLQGKSHFCIPFLGIARPQSQFPQSCVCERFTLYIPRIGPRTVFPCSWIGRPGNIKISHRYMSLGDRTL
jgi:hypothetical protein